MKGMTVMTFDPRDPAHVRALRERLGLSQQRLADRMRALNPLLLTDRNTISRWERGVRHPDPHASAALARIAQETDHV